MVTFKVRPKIGGQILLNWNTDTYIYEEKAIPVMCVMHQKLKTKTNTFNKTEGRRSLDKTLFFYLLPFLLLQTDKLWRREHRVIQTSQCYCQSTNKSLWQQQTTEAQQKKKQEEQHLATINILEKTSEVKKGVLSAFLIVNSISTSSWTR